MDRPDTTQPKTVAHPLDLPMWTEEAAAEVAAILDAVAARKAKQGNTKSARYEGDRRDNRRRRESR
jgi:hypothetical protein